MEPFKESINKKAVRHIAKNIKAVAPEFPDKKFVRQASSGLAELELKARVHHVIDCLKDNLPDEYLDTLAILVATGEQWEKTENVFIAWPVIDFIGEHGLDHFDASMDGLAKLTHLFSSEFAIRGFILQDPKRALKIIKGWTKHPSEHVRRLASEGIRPRLPWGKRLTPFIEDPSPILPILEALKDDEAEYVRRSVANNLNDIAKDHPELVLKTGKKWLRGASKERKWVVRHASRTLVKAGHPGAMELLGFDPKVKVSIRNFALIRK